MLAPSGQHRPALFIGRLMETKQSLEQHPHRGAKVAGSGARSGVNYVYSSSKLTAATKHYSDFVSKIKTHIYLFLI
jgi:hypothetical protein